MNQISLLLLFVCVLVHQTWVVNGFRCKGINTGCCTADNPCEKYDGDCDNDSECAGGLTCGYDNCNFGDDAEFGDSADDCCIGEKYPNKCKENNGGCSHKCVSVEGEVKCECPDHYTLESDKKTCSGPYVKVTSGRCKSASKSICEQMAKDEEIEFKTSTKTKGKYPAGCYISSGKLVLYNKNTDNRAADCSTSRVCYCEEVKDECSVANGGCSHTCVKTADGHVCQCPPGFTLGADKKTCSDVNECLVGNGGCSHKCVNTDGGYECQCPCGYSLGADKKTCSVDNPCTVGNGGCSHKCVKTDSGFECQCPNGYVLSADKKTCSDINECSVGNGGCKHTCVNTAGGFECQCPSGYTLTNNDCYDVNECSILNGGCSHKCVNTNGGFECQCPRGFILGTDKKTCSVDPVHPCDKPDKGGCSQVCTKFGHDWVCECQGGYKFDTDGKTCIKSVLCEWLRDTQYAAGGGGGKNINPAPMDESECVEQCLRLREMDPVYNGITRFNQSDGSTSCKCMNSIKGQKYRLNSNICYFQENKKTDYTDCMEKDIGYFGGDIRTVENVKSGKDCMEYCKRDRACKVWTLVVAYNRCYLKERKSARTHHKGMISGANYCEDPSCREYDVGYYGPPTHRNYHSGIKSWKRCQELCTMDPECKFWTLTLDTDASCLLKKARHGRVRKDGWIAGSDSCSDMTCGEMDVTYYGRVMKIYKKLKDWKVCQSYCEKIDNCNYWTLDVGTQTCNLKSSKTGSSNQKGMISGHKKCRWRNQESW